MKRLSQLFYILPIALLTLAACDTFDDETPTFNRDIYEQDSVNTTIGEIKSRYASVISSSSYELVKEDLVFDAYVIGNDISGNLYQTLILRKGDDGISMGVGKTSLWVNYPVGTRVTVNLKGMYVGGYGKMAKIGIPYKNSNGNIKLGSITENLFKSNVKIVGYDKNADELVPVEITSSWLKTADKDKYAPTLVHVKDVTIKGYSNREIFAKYSDSDASNGNGVDDIIQFSDGSQCTLRTSTLCDFASDTIPTGTVDIYGILSRYSNDWQIQLRSLDDVVEH